jgi:hypothetical protein
MDTSDVTSKAGMLARPGDQGHLIADFTLLFNRLLGEV